jgi:hypothetical protein
MRFFWLGILLLFSATAYGGVTNELIAHYRFATNSSDSLGKSPPFAMTNALFSHGTVKINGVYENNGIHDHYLATAPIKALNYESFTVSLDFCPQPGKPFRKFNKAEELLDSLTSGRYTRWLDLIDNDTDNILTGGMSYRWLDFNRDDGTLNLTLNNQRFLHKFTGVKVKLNQWHNLVCSVDLRQKRIFTSFDGQTLEVIKLPPDFKLDIIGSPDDAIDREFSFVNYSSASVFRGYAANLKVFGRALTEPELAALYTESATERPTFNPNQSSQLFVLMAILAFAAALVFALARFWRTRSPRNTAKQAAPTTG